MTPLLVIGLKGLGFIGYMLVEHFLGKTKWGSAIGVILSSIKKEGNL